MVKKSYYGLEGCCQVCKDRLENEGALRQVGCKGTKYPNRLCSENTCRQCTNLFEYDDEKTARMIDGEVYFDTEGECTFYGKLAYENAKDNLKRVKKDF
jgi:hypothetical protein